MPNIQIVRENSLGLNRGIYADWMGNALSDANANALLAEGSAVTVLYQQPFVSGVLTGPQAARPDITGVVASTEDYKQALPDGNLISMLLQGKLSASNKKLQSQLALSRQNAAIVKDASIASKVTEDFASIADWALGSANGVQISGGKLYGGTSVGAGSGLNRSFQIAADENLTAVAKVTLASDVTSGAIGIGVDSSAAGSAPGNGASTAFGIFLQSAGEPARQMSNGTASAIEYSTITAGDYTVTVTVDQKYISVYAVKDDASRDFYCRRLRSGFAVNNLWLFNSRTGQLSSHSINSLTAVKGITSIDGVTTVTGVYSGDGTQDFRVWLPAGYDAKRSYPLCVMFHGNGSDENHWDNNTNGAAIKDEILAAGYICLGVGYIASNTTWGNAASGAAYKAGYNYIINNFSVRNVVIYANSMGGIESLNAIVNGDIPDAAAWVGTSATANLATAYANATFTSVITSAYGINGGNPFDTATAGRDPMLREAWEFKGIPMMFLSATDDTVIPRETNADLFIDKVKCCSAEIVNVSGITGGHSFAMSGYASQIVAFLDKYAK